MIIHTRHESVFLARNMLGDSAEHDLYVYVPRGYEDSDRRYATAFLLHAFGESAATVVSPDTSGERWRPPIEDVLDPVFGRMGVPPMIVVIPDGNCRWGCGQWIDSPVSGFFGSYVAKDVVSYVDANYRTIPAAAASRGVFGFSSGGMGAWNVVSQNPDVFTAMAVLSADTFLDMTHKVFTYKFFNSIWPEPPNGPVDDDWSEMVYAYSAAYAPNPDNPPFFVDLPVAWPSGELIQEVWDRWLRNDPVENCRERLDNLRKLSGILLDAGSRDNYELQWGHRVLHHRLTEAGIAHDFTENPGNHGGRANERLQIALSWLGKVLRHE